MKRLLILILIFPYLHAIANPGSQLPDSAVKKMDSVVNALMTKRKIVGASVAIVSNGQIAYAKGFGYSDRIKKIHPTENTVFSIGSITKTFTAMAILKLRDEGRIDLDKPASFYIPELKIKSLAETGDILKIRNLLSHTSGLGDGVMNNDACSVGADLNTVIANLNDEVLVHKTGWKMSYSNVGYDVLGIVIQNVTGMKYEDYIMQNFLVKMDMKQSGFYNHPEDTAFSKGYTKDTVETSEPILRDMSAGRLFCSANDMCHFMQMVLNKGMYNGIQIVSEKSLKEMETSHVDDVKLYEQSDYGYAMFLEKMYNKEDSLYGIAVGHGGDTYVFHSACFMFPKINLGIVVLTNSEKGHSFSNSVFNNLFKTWMQTVKGVKLHPLPTVSADQMRVPKNQPDIKEVEGSYAVGEKFTLKIKRINDHKLILTQDKAHIILKKEKNGTWSAAFRFLYFFSKKMDGVFMAFEKIDGDIYFLDMSDKYGRIEYVCIKDNAPPIPASWKAAAGKYKLLNACEGNRQGAPEEIIVKNNKIYLKVKFDEKNTSNFSFNAIDDNLAAIDGLDRRSGMIMKLLPNGHVYFSGYEMVKE